MMDKDYSDIIDLPHHVSKKHSQMPISDRAAQFAPFAALTGHSAAMKETERLTEDMVQLTEDETYMLNEKLQFVLEHKDEVQVQITYFVPDERKEGGRYETVLGYVEKIDRFNKKIRIRSGENISVCDIISINFV